jgi:hypothetical protein
MRRQPDPDFVRVEADEPTYLDEWNPSFLDKTSDVPWCRTENLGNLKSVKKSWKFFDSGCDVTPRAPDTHRWVSASTS